MEVTINSPSTVRHEISVILTPEEIQPLFDKAYVKASKTLEIHGFRKGKAPLTMIKKLYGEEIEYRELDEVANFFYKQIVKEKGLRPVGEPMLQDIHYHRGEKLTFVVSLDVLPDFDLQELKGIPAQNILHKVTDEEIEGEVSYLRRAHATLGDVPQATDDDHIVTVEIQELDETGLPIVGHKTDAIQILLSDESKLLEIREGLKGAEVGKNYRITYSPQQGESQEPIDGEFTVNRIQKVTLPDLSEEFLKKITKGKIDNLEQFRTQIREDLERSWNERSARKLEDELANEIVRRHSFDVPESLLKGFLDGMLEDVRERQPRKVLPEGFDEAKFREENRSYALWQAKWFLLRDKIRLHLELKIEDADYEKLAETEAAKIGIEKERLVNYYKNSKTMNEKILNDKMFEYLLSNAVVDKIFDTEISESNLITG